MVASGDARSSARTSPSFNPLHCGAVVASVVVLATIITVGLVSIPFIAGQWSLPGSDCELLWHRVWFQSPSLRGSGRFYVRNLLHATVRKVSIPFIAGQWSLLGADLAEARADVAFQSPSLRGSGRFAELVSDQPLRPLLVSIPFIAGQWSLQFGADYYVVGLAEFQSPSLRGSGRFGHQCEVGRSV